MSAPRHRQDGTHELPLRNYQPQIPLRSSDFDAVSPMRRPAPQARDRWAEEETPSALSTSDALFLSHS